MRKKTKLPGLIQTGIWVTVGSIILACVFTKTYSLQDALLWTCLPLFIGAILLFLGLQAQH